MISTSTNLVQLNKVDAFTKDGSTLWLPTRADLHILHSWKTSTLLSYNSAVKKFMAFQKSEKVTTFSLPIDETTLENFCILAGRNSVSSNTGKISATSLRKYLAGLKAWHTYHNKPFPTSNKTRINLILKASSREDKFTTRTSQKKPLMFWHMTHLWVTLSGGDDFDKAVLDLFIVAFWGLAR
ncbi:hypothetical protein PGT21_005051 [Puccinia graminis f. sp. tritici]|uniref:Core-binding (CB) domain-containing protein n=1 Tax=Puccinia graminis f. sp. tritici TaxID=56615 RepID=A0A5B0MBB7_PUCGR|nr:hypothetical protein PGT21_005051 [Puccinia graminis f. sp. tritici]